MPRLKGDWIMVGRFLSGSLYVAILSVIVAYFFPVISQAAEGDQKWKFQTGGSIVSSPAIGDDGAIYVGSDDGYVYAISPYGGGKWAFQTGNLVQSSPAISSEGVLYVGSYDYKLYAINPDGTEAWEFGTTGQIYSSPAVDSNGVIYVGSDDALLYAIDRKGVRKWFFPTGDRVRSSPAISNDGTIYVGSDDTRLYAVNSDGAGKWSFKTGGMIRSSPAIGSNGIIYVGSADGKVYAINTDGTKKWEFETGGSISSSIVIGSDSSLYVGSEDGNVYCIKSDGARRWLFSTSGPVLSSPVLGNDGILYIGSNDRVLYAINSNDGTEKWSLDLANVAGPSSPVIGFGGTLYIGCGDGSLYAVETTAERIAVSPWPLFKHDVRHTGRNNPNQGPTASAGNDQTVKQESTVTLNGSASVDPDYGIPLYKWTQSDGTSVALSDSSAVNPAFTAPDSTGTLTFMLTVTDNSGAQSTDTCIVEVTEKGDDDGGGCFISTIIPLKEAGTCVLCLQISERKTPPATDTFREAILPAEGMLTTSWQRFKTAGLRPFCSLPRTSTSFRFQSKSYKVTGPSSAAPIIQKPLSFRKSSALPMFTTLDTGRCI